MQCPGCGAPMEHLRLEGRLGASVEINLCAHCGAFWFEPFETIQLTNQSTLQLFDVIAADGKHTAFPDTSYCPRCRARLLLTHDRQRNTPFQYWRCPNEHGRFTSFADFLREKDFVHPVTGVPTLRSVNCSNCGAPIDVSRTSVCGHCGTAVAIVLNPLPAPRREGR